MKTALLILVLWMHAVVASTLAFPPNPPIGEVLKDWKTIKITLIISGGDTFGPDPFILLQRLDGDHVFLSTMQPPPVEHAEFPVARAVLTNAAAAKYVDRAHDFYIQALLEVSERARVNALPKAEQEAFWKAHNLGIGSFSIKIEVLGREHSYVYEHDFADEGETWKEFYEFVQNPKIGLP
jgi:hypothetical protein